MDKDEIKSIFCKWCGDSAKKGKECHLEPMFANICPVEVIFIKLKKENKETSK